MMVSIIKCHCFIIIYLICADLEANKELLITNAENLMTKTSEVLRATEALMIYNVPAERRADFTDLNWIKRAS